MDLTAAQKAELLQLCSSLIEGSSCVEPSTARLIVEAQRSGDVAPLLAAWGSSLSTSRGPWKVEGRIAVYSITGPIFADCPEWMQEYGFTSSRLIASNCDALAADPMIDGVVISWLCPGGVDVNRDEATSAMDRLRRAKPVVSHAGVAASLGYW